MLRKAVFKGSWYPGALEELDEMVSVEGCGDYRAAVLPHSGLFYSAPLISDFFKGLSDAVKRIVIISPSHYYPLASNRLYVSDFSLSETPYGNIRTEPFPLEGEVFNNAIAKEHGIEMFLPFVKKKGLVVSYALLTSFSSFGELEKMGMRLAEVIDDETALIASSDFTHYGKRFGYAPYGSDALEKVEKQDFMVASALAEGRVEDVFKIHRDMTICGSAPAMLLSYLMAESGDEGFLGKHYTSYDVYAQDADDFVSYFDVFWRRK